MRPEIDEIQNLDLGTRIGAEASDQIKYLSERISATFVLAGVDVDGSGLFAGRRGGQIASRYSLIATKAFPHATVEQDRKSTRLNSSHTVKSYAVFCLKQKDDRV